MTTNRMGEYFKKVVENSDVPDGALFLADKVRGMGDRLEKVLDAVGVSTVVKAAAAAVGVKDCGCSKRREKLNRIGNAQAE